MQLGWVTPVPDGHAYALLREGFEAKHNESAETGGFLIITTFAQSVALCRGAIRP
jgi:hypothetical protein